MKDKAQQWEEAEAYWRTEAFRGRPEGTNDYAFGYWIALRYGPKMDVIEQYRNPFRTPEGKEREAMGVADALGDMWDISP